LCWTDFCTLQRFVVSLWCILTAQNWKSGSRLERVSLHFCANGCFDVSLYSWVRLLLKEFDEQILTQIIIILLSVVIWTLHYFCVWCLCRIILFIQSSKSVRVCVCISCISFIYWNSLSARLPKIKQNEWMKFQILTFTFAP